MHPRTVEDGKKPIRLRNSPDAKAVEGTVTILTMLIVPVLLFLLLKCRYPNTAHV
jgi:hypothetical protein